MHALNEHPRIMPDTEDPIPQQHCHGNSNLTQLWHYSVQDKEGTEVQPACICHYGYTNFILKQKVHGQAAKWADESTLMLCNSLTDKWCTTRGSEVHVILIQILPDLTSSRWHCWRCKCSETWRHVGHTVPSCSKDRSAFIFRAFWNCLIPKMQSPQSFTHIGNYSFNSTVVQPRGMNLDE